MSASAIAAFVVPLAFDTLAVAIALGLRGVGPVRPALSFALFEGLMPLAGLLLGRAAGAWIETPAAVLGGIVLLGVAASIVREALEADGEAERLSFASLRSTLAAGFGVSMDELAVGFPMGTAGVPVLPAIVAIAVQAFVVTIAGIGLGRRAGAALGARASRGAGLAAGAAFALLGVYLIVQRFVPGFPEL